jgi:hypothetical protein
MGGGHTIGEQEKVSRHPNSNHHSSSNSRSRSFMTNDMFHQDMTPPFPPHGSNDKNNDHHISNSNTAHKHVSMTQFLPPSHPNRSNKQHATDKATDTDINEAAAMGFIASNSNLLAMNDVRCRGRMRIERWIEGKGVL